MMCFPLRASLHRIATTCAAPIARTEVTLTPVKDSHGTFKDTMTVELDVEYALGAFYSLQSGLLPATDEQSGAPLIQSGDAVQWKELPTSTRVGWRGPMILWNHVLHDIEPLFCGP